MARLSLVARLRTLVWLRFKTWRHGLRRTGGMADAAVGAILNLLGIGAAVGLAFALGALSRSGVESGDDEVMTVSLLIVTWLLAFFAIGLPAFVGIAQRLQISRLAVFPISRGALYLLALVSSAAAGAHLLWYPALFATGLFAAVLPPVSHLPAMGLIALLALALVAWSHTIQLLLEAVMRRRRAKELLVLGAFTLFFAASLLPALIDSNALGMREKPVLVDVVVEVSRPVVALFPPHLAANGLAALHRDDPSTAGRAIGGLLMWAVAALALGYGVLSRSLLEGGAARPAGRKGVGRHPSHGGGAGARFDPLARLPNGLAAVMMKELRYILRSTPGKLCLAIAPMFVVMISLAVGKLMFAKENLFGMEPGSYALYGVLLYAALLSANFFLNSFAWEGPGLTAYLIGPLSAREVLLGKNLGVVLFELIVLVEAFVVWTLIRGWPDLSTALNGALVFATALLVLMGVGNFVSVAFPVKRSISAVANSASQIGTLVSFASVLASAVLTGAMLVLGLALGGGPVQVALLSILVTALAAANVFLLRPAADLFEDRAEQLQEALAGRET